MTKPPNDNGNPFGSHPNGEGTGGPYPEEGTYPGGPQ